MNDIKSKANQGNIKAIDSLALECLKTKQYHEAFEWLSKGTELGSVFSTTNLALFYASGVCGEQNDQIALSLFSRAACLGANLLPHIMKLYNSLKLNSLAMTGDPNAQYYYALLLAATDGPSEESDKYIQMAAQKNMPLALAVKGLISLLSNRIPDNTDAAEYLVQALDNGYDYHALINSIKQTFSSSSISHADGLVQVIRALIQEKKSKRSYVLAKITRAEYADGFIKEGKVYMQPMDNFRKSDQPGVGDMLEGISNTGPNQFWVDMLQQEAVCDISKCGMYDEYMAHERLLCFYALECDENGNFVAPDIRLRQFGESVVLIMKPEIFLKRLKNALQCKHGNVWMGHGRVQYSIDPAVLGYHDEFSKTEPFAWQNEFRFVEDIANGCLPREAWDGISDSEREKLAKQGKTSYEKLKMKTSGMSDFAKLMALSSTNLYEEKGAEIIALGNLTDICKVYSMEEFISLSPDFLDAVNRSTKGTFEYIPEHNKPYVLRPIILGMD